VSENTLSDFDNGRTMGSQLIEKEQKNGSLRLQHTCSRVELLTELQLAECRVAVGCSLDEWGHVRLA
jgi:hypothetical protein